MTLTTKQAAVLGFIENSIIYHRKTPTIREIGKQFGFQSTGTTREYLKQLSAKGYIKLNKRQARSIELTSRASFKIPILGKIAAGNPILAAENEDTALDLEKILPNEDKHIFGLKITGDSMIEKGIQEGDIAIIKKQPHAENEDIVAALLENEATVKILKKKLNTAVLMPANKNYAPIKGPFSIIGKVIAIIRQYY